MRSRSIVWLAACVLAFVACRELAAAPDVKVHGLVQSVAQLAEEDKAFTFGFDRVRLIARGGLNKWAKLKVQVDFKSLATGAGASQLAKDGETPAMLKDAVVTFTCDRGNMLHAGKFKTPVGMELNRSGSKLLFVKRGFGHSAMVFDRNVGLMAQTAKMGGMRFQADLGIFNKGPRNANDTGDVSAGADYTLTGSVKAKPFKGAYSHLYFGAAGTSVAGQEPVSLFGAGLSYKPNSALELAGEFIQRDDPDHPDSDGSTYYAQATWRPLPWLQPAFKYESLDAANDDADRGDITLGLNVLYNPDLPAQSKIMFNYVLSDMDGASALQIMFQGAF